MSPQATACWTYLTHVGWCAECAAHDAPCRLDHASPRCPSGQRLFDDAARPALPPTGRGAGCMEHLRRGLGARQG